ncbi:O-antigen ligase family protein [Maricaulaceae bacterium MS644]
MIRFYTVAVFFFWIFFSGIFMGAGGLGLSSSIGFIGLMWSPLLLLPALLVVRARPPALIAFFAFMALAAMSLLWSPYGRPDQAVKLLLLTPLFLLVPFGIARLDDTRRVRFAAYTAIITLLVAVFFLAESVLGAPVSQFVQVSVSGETPSEALALAHRVLSRGASAFILLAGPMTIWLWRAGWRAPAGLVALSAALSTVSFGVEANIVAMAAGCTLGAAAFLRPHQALPVLFYAAAGLVALTPLILGAVVASTPDSVANALPLSWHQRLEIWDYALSRLPEAPLFGHGLDASRVIDAEMMLRGYTLNLMPLHPHNGALHIWLETGALGAGLAAAALLLTGRSLARRPLDPAVAAGIAFSTSAWFVMTMLGYGVWQEWHHGALSLAIAACLFLRSSGKTLHAKAGSKAGPA